MNEEIIFSVNFANIDLFNNMFELQKTDNFAICKFQYISYTLLICLIASVKLLIT